MKAVPGGKVSNTPKKSAGPAASVAHGATGKKLADVVAPTSANEIEPEVCSQRLEVSFPVSCLTLGVGLIGLIWNPNSAKVWNLGFDLSPRLLNSFVRCGSV